MMGDRMTTVTWVCGIIVFLLSGMCAYGHAPTNLRITVDPEPTYVGQMTEFAGDARHGDEDLGEGGANWAWDFGDGTGGNGKVVQHGYGAAGTYTVRLTVTVGGDSASTTAPVRVKQLGIQMEPCPYSWLPRNGNTVSLSATIKERMPGEAWQTSTQERIITFTLSNVSHQPGVCMNWGGGMGPDLTLEAGQNPNYNVDPGNMTATRKGPTNRGTIVVSSWDYGGWGYLEATAPMCVQIDAPNRNGPEVEIPYDLVPAPPNANRVADGWIGDPYWDESMAWDQDTTPQGNGTNGDALAMYEEYRGFIIGGAHSRGASWVDTKQVFVRSELGPGYAVNLANHGVILHSIQVDELDANQRIDFNGNLGVAQHAILVQDAGYDPVDLGATWRPLPDRTYCAIYTQRIRELSDPTHDRVTEDPVDNNKRAHTIAHEIGHGVGMDHYDYAPGGRYDVMVRRLPVDLYGSAPSQYDADSMDDFHVR